MKYILKTSKLSLNPESNQNKSIIYTGSPSKGQKDKGKLIILFDFPENTENVKELGNLLIQKIHKLYYESTIIEQETILEKILEETNENLPLLTEINKDWIKNFNALITIIYRQDVYFSPVGNISAWISSDNKSNNKVVNIFDYLDSDIDKPSIDKIFTNILSGNIKPDQSLIFGTSSIFDYVSNEKIESIITENDPQGVVAKLKEMLFEIKNKSFCLISVKLSPFEQILEEKTEIIHNVQADTAKESIDKLLNIQQKTKEILIKGKTKNKKEVKKIISKSNLEKIDNNQKIDFDSLTDPSLEDDISPDKLYTQQETVEENTNYEDYNQSQQNDIQKLNNTKTKNKKNKILLIFTKTIEKIYEIIILPFAKFPQTISKIKNKNNRGKNISIQKQNNAPITIFRRSKKNSKIALIIGIIILICFGVSLFFTNYKKESQLENEKYDKIVSEINDKKMEYDLVNIYKDENLAKEKLKEISDLINSLPQKTKNQIEKYQEVLNSFSEILNKVNKLETIKDPEIIFEAGFNPKKIFKQGNNLIILGANSNEITKIDTSSKQGFSQGKENIYNSINLYGKDTNLTYGIDLKDLVKINLDNFEITRQQIPYHPNYKAAKSIEFYANNLYIVDPQSNQIYKHNGNNGNFDKGVEWIKDKTDVSNVLSIAIDTNIYLGKSDGSILKMFAGKIVPMEIKNVDPKIQTPSKVYTDKSIDQIYILDSSSKRIIVINKKGELLKQYFLPTLKEINDFVFDGASKKMYIISENKIISLNISF